MLALHHKSRIVKGVRERKRFQVGIHGRQKDVAAILDRPHKVCSVCCRPPFPWTSSSPSSLPSR
jgi:hypothetical protein